MAKFVQFNVRLFAGAADLTGRSNKVELAMEHEEKDATTYLAEGDPDSGWKKVLGGLGSFALGGEGFWEAGDLTKVDNESWAGLGVVQAFTVCPNGAAVGNLAWVLKAMRAQYKLGGQVGEIAPWTATAAGSWPVGRGKVLHPPGTARTATGDGTAVEVAAVTDAQYLYASLHVLSVSGTDTPTITVIVESDVDANFDGSETTRISFAAATAVGGQVLRAAGPITDTFYRVSHTISGTNPSFLYLCAIGIK